jgi:hypothetical protein
MVLVLRSTYFSGIAWRCRFTPTLLDFSNRIARSLDVRDSFLGDDISSRLQMLWNYPSICLNLHEDICAEMVRTDQNILCQERSCLYFEYMRHTQQQSEPLNREYEEIGTVPSDGYLRVQKNIGTLNLF